MVPAQSGNLLSGTTFRRQQTPDNLRTCNALQGHTHSPCAGNRQAIAATGAPTMPDEPRRRIILEKSSTVRRRYQRSNKRFKFTAEQIAKIEREQKAEKRAKELRDKEQKRIEKKKKKAEKEAHDREERRRLGLPDPNAPKVPSSQPLLSNFLAKRPAPTENVSAKEPSLEPESDHDPTPTESEINGHDNVASAEPESTGGDTEVDSEFDDLDFEIEREMSNIQDAEAPTESDIHNGGHGTSKDGSQIPCTDADDDGFSDCSAFDDEEIIKEMANATMRPTHDPPGAQKPSLSTASTVLQPPPSNHPKGLTTSMVSVGDSFRDETADFLEQDWANLDTCR